MKIKLLSLFFASFIMTNAYAGFSQTINLCIDASGNDTPTNFIGHFASSDIFDKGEYTIPIHNSKFCVGRDYGHGPKNISIKLTATPGRGDMTLLVPSASCSYLSNVKGDPITLKSSYIKTTGKVETWDIKFVKIAPQDGYKTVFNVVCEQNTQD